MKDLTGESFLIDGESWFIYTYGTVTCLCVAVEDESNKLWRFDTSEVIKYLLEKLNAA